MAQFIDNVDWEKEEAVNGAAFKGFDAPDFVENEMKDYIRSVGGVEMEFAGCPRGSGKDDVHKWEDLMTSVGWKFLTISNFGAKNLKEFRENMPLRFHPTVESDGRLRFRNSFIMYMRKDVRKRMIEGQAAAAYGELSDMQKTFETPSLDAARAAKGLASGDERVAAFGSPLEIKKVPASEFAKE